MAEIIKQKKKVIKVNNSGRIVIQNVSLKKYIGRNVIVTVTTN
jgi:putative transposon-encoded protein